MSDRRVPRFVVDQAAKHFATSQRSIYHCPRIADGAMSLAILALLKHPQINFDDRQLADGSSDSRLDVAANP